MGRFTWVVCAAVLWAGCSGSSKGSTSTGGSGGPGGSSGSGTSGSGSTSGTGSSGGTTSGGSLATYQQFCQALSSTECAALSRCGVIDPAAEHECNLSADCDAGAGYAYDATQAGACLALYNGADCHLGLVYAIFGFEPDGGQPCTAATMPGVAVGGACDRSSGECQPLPDGGQVSCIRSSDASCGGVCKASAAVGESCSQVPCLDSQCGPTQVCTAYLALGAPCTFSDSCDPSVSYCGPPADGGFTSTYCDPLVPAGQPCSFGGCVAGTYCGTQDGGFSGRTCQPQLAAGSPCSGTSYDSCVSGSTCFQGTCQASPAPLGAPCGFGGSGTNDCAEGFCNNFDGGIGACLAPGVQSGPCTGSSQCAGSLLCFQGQCTSTPAMGSACDSNTGCQNGYCDNFDGGLGTCVAYLATGGSCSVDDMCYFPEICVAGACANPPTAGHGCGMPGYLFFDQGCAGGDYCLNGQCTLYGSLGAPCTSLPSSSSGSTCQSGYCDATGHCAPYLAVGQSCDPTLFECSSSQQFTSVSDGGYVYVDGNCRAPATGGSVVCTATCN